MTDSDFDFFDEDYDEDSDNDMIDEDMSALFADDNNYFLEYTDTDGETTAVVPDGVTIIGDMAFSDSRLVEEIILPDSLIEIGMGAFSNCVSLKRIVLPENLRVIDDYAFDGCLSLEEITIPAGVNDVGTGIFRYCHALKRLIVDANNTVFDSRGDCNAIISTAANRLACACGASVIPDTVKEIGRCAFCELDMITSVTVPDSVTKIGDHAFSDCVNLTAVSLPDSLTKIGRYAFSGCENLTEISLPRALEEIDSYAFYFCKNLVGFTIPSAVTSIGHDVFFNTAFYRKRSNWQGTALYKDGCLIKVRDRAEGAFVIEDGTRLITVKCFEGCKKLTSVTMPDSMRYIGRQAFTNCATLAYVYFNDGLLSVGESCFEDCVALTEAILCGTETYVGIRAFRHNFQLKKLVIAGIPENVNALLGDLSYNTTIQSFVCPNVSLSDIRHQTLKNAAITGFVENISMFSESGQSEYAASIHRRRRKILPELFAKDNVAILELLDRCGKITKTNIDEDFLETAREQHAVGCIAWLMDWANRNITDKDRERAIQRELTRDPFCVTEMKKQWSYVVLPDDTVMIKGYKGKSNAVFIPERIGKRSVSTIEDEAFNPLKSHINEFSAKALRNIVSVTIPEGVTRIGEFAFRDCEKLESVSIPSTVTEIGEGIFFRCMALKEIVIDGNNPRYDSRDSCNAVIETSSNTLLIGCAGTVIPDGVTTVGKDAFRSCKNLNTISFPPSVTAIGNSAFEFCENLTAIDLPDTIKTIGNNAFQHSGVQTARLPAGLTEISDCMFLHCDSLTTVTIPETVTSIGNSAFAACRNLDPIGIPEAVTHIGRDAFLRAYSLFSHYHYRFNEPVFIRDNCLLRFSEDYRRKVTLPDGIRLIADYALSSLEATEYIILPDGVKIIGNNAFESCERLKSVTIPDSVNMIGEDIFKGVPLPHIRCHAGTFAEEYAERNRILCEIIE